MKKLLFIHIPKNAGSSIRCLLENNKKFIDKNNFFKNPELLPTVVLYFLLINSFFNNKLKIIEKINSFYDGKFINNHTLFHHNTILYYKKYLKNFNDYEPFCIVRHPYNRILSLFYFTHPKSIANNKVFNIFLHNLNIIQK